MCEHVLGRVAEALTSCGAQPFQYGLAAGTVAWDDCCGQLNVAPERIYRTARWPIEGPDENNCYEGEIAVDLVVLLVRCVPTLDDRGNPPTPAALSNAYGLILDDGAIVWNELAHGDWPDDWKWTNEAQTFVGAEGGCIAVETRITVGIDQELWCTGCPPEAAPLPAPD